MILAAIDIGSNAVRLQITRVINSNGNLTFKKVQYIRFPLRLGSDVFTFSEIKENKYTEFRALMRAFKIMVDLYDVEDYYACATSAMREAKNGKDLVEDVWNDCGLAINIIDGNHEADLINKVVEMHLNAFNTQLHIDVGGGSTELNIYHGRTKVISKSFPIGTVRILEHSDQQETWDQMDEWIAFNLKDELNVTTIGTGGNIRKLFELAKGEKGKSIDLQNLASCYESLRKMGFENRMKTLQLNADRADVILPASEIYINIMKKANAHKIVVPNVGLKDGIIAYLYDKNKTIKR